MNRVILGPMSLVVIVLSIPSHAQKEKMKLGEVLVLRMLDRKPEGGAVDGFLFQADRGSRKGQYAQVGGREGGLEYRLLSPEKVGPLPEVDVLGIHYVKVRPERREAFERFVSEKIHPAVGNLRPDLRVLYYKLVKGTDASNDIALFALTKESRDKYWPKGADSDELRAAFTPAVKALTKELSTYLVEGSYLADEKFAAAVYESREWTDFVLVPSSG